MKKNGGPNPEPPKNLRCKVNEREEFHGRNDPEGKGEAVPPTRACRQDARF